MAPEIKGTYLFTRESAALVLGANDRNLSYIEALLGVQISVRGTSVTADPAPEYFTSFMERLEKAASERGVLNEPEIYMEFQALGREGSDDKDDLRIYVPIQNRIIYPRSEQQRHMVKALKTSDVVFALGPAGTGKTFLSVIWALSEVLRGHKGKLLLARPVVEAGESLGFLPGDLQQKLSPYLRPLFDAMEYALHPKHIQRMEENGSIEIAPLAYMRGRSVSNAVMILDEAQNATAAQIKMFLTRIGENCQAIITGDPSQVDLTGKEESGLSRSASILSGIRGISVVEFTHADTVRSRIVRDIVQAYSLGRADGRAEDNL